MEKIKNFLYCILASIIVSPIIFIILDLCNITTLSKHFSSVYDWLSFFGSYISAVATSILGLATISITTKLSEQNRKILEDDLKSNCYSEIVIRGEHDFEKINLDGNYHYQLKFKVADKNRRILSRIRVSNVVIREHTSGDILYAKAYDNYEINLEYTPEKAIFRENIIDDFYFARIDLAKESEKILDHKEEYVKIEIDAEFSNVFNVITGRKYTIVVHNIVKSNVDKIEYILTKRFHDFSVEPVVYYGKEFRK